MRNQKGFTLLELVLVLVLIGIVSFLIGPRFASINLKNDQLEEAKMQFISVVTKTRNKAILTEQSQKFLIYVDTKGVNRIRLYKNNGEEITPTIPLNQAKLLFPVGQTSREVQFDKQGRVSNLKSQIFTFKSLDASQTLKLHMSENGYVEEVYE